MPIILTDLTLVLIRDILDRIDAQLSERAEPRFDGRVERYRVISDAGHEALFELRLALDREILRQAETAGSPQ